MPRCPRVVTYGCVTPSATRWEEVIRITIELMELHFSSEAKIQAERPTRGFGCGDGLTIGSRILFLQSWRVRPTLSF